MNIGASPGPDPDDDLDRPVSARPHSWLWPVFLVLAGLGFSGLGIIMLGYDRRHAEAIAASRAENMELRGYLQERYDRVERFTGQVEVQHRRMQAALDRIEARLEDGEPAP